MSDLSEVDKQNIARYEAAQLAMQRRIVGDERNCQPRHLRVGVNTAMSDHGALVKVLVRNGVITDSDYFAEIAKAMEQELTLIKPQPAE